MDSNYLISHDGRDIAGFQHVDAAHNIQKVWCSECAVKDSEDPPYTLPETDLQIPDTDSVSGAIDSLIYRISGDKYNPSGSEFNLSHMECDECGQTLHPQ
jgi:hypothetical protein